MKKESQFVKSTLILFVGTVMPKLASFITLPLFTACLTRSEYGAYDLIITLCSLLMPVVSLMMPSATFRFMLDCQNDSEKIKSIVTNTLVPGSIIAFFSLILLYFCLYSFDPLVRLLMCIYLLVDVISFFLQQIARGLSKNHIYSISAIVLSFLNMLFAVLALCVFHSGLTGVLICLIASTFISAVYIIIHIRFFSYVDFKKTEIKVMKEIVKYSWPLIPNNISSWAMNMSDRLIILYFMNIEKTAVLAVAHKIPQILLLAQNAYNMAWQENAAISSKDKAPAEYYTKMFRLLYDFMAGATMLLIAWTPILFAVLVRGNYDEAFYQIPVYIFAFFLSCISAFLGGIYIAYKKTLSVGITTIISAVINIIVNIMLVKFIGLFAASISTVCGYLFIDIYRYLDIKRLIRIKFDIKRIFMGLLLVVFSSVLCYQRNVITDIINIVLSTVIFVILNRILFMQMIDLIKRKINKTPK